MYIVMHVDCVDLPRRARLLQHSVLSCTHTNNIAKRQVPPNARARPSSVQSSTSYSRFAKKLFVMKINYENSLATASVQLKSL